MALTHHHRIILPSSNIKYVDQSHFVTKAVQPFFPSLICLNSEAHSMMEFADALVGSKVLQLPLTLHSANSH